MPTRQFAVLILFLLHVNINHRKKVFKINRTVNIKRMLKSLLISSILIIYQPYQKLTNIFPDELCDNRHCSNYWPVDYNPSLKFRSNKYFNRCWALLSEIG